MLGDLIGFEGELRNVNWAFKLKESVPSRYKYVETAMGRIAYQTTTKGQREWEAELDVTGEDMAYIEELYHSRSGTPFIFIPGTARISNVLTQDQVSLKGSNYAAYVGGFPYLNIPGGRSIEILRDVILPFDRVDGVTGFSFELSTIGAVRDIKVSASYYVPAQGGYAGAQVWRSPSEVKGTRYRWYYDSEVIPVGATRVRFYITVSSGESALVGKPQVHSQDTFVPFAPGGGTARVVLDSYTKETGLYEVETKDTWYSTQLSLKEVYVGL